jgi:hypothetical protein
MKEKSADKIWDLPETKEWLARAEREMFPKMKTSLLSLVIVSEPDAKLAVEIGAAILFDKPIIVLVPSGTWVSPKLRRIADAIVEIDGSTEEGKEETQKNLREVLQKYTPLGIQ